MSLERISDAELTIMEILWEQAPLTATDVRCGITNASRPVDSNHATTLSTAR